MHKKMNKRMMELYKQAHVPVTAYDPSNNMPYETLIFSVNKYTELLVKECIAVNGEFVGRRIGEIDLDLVYKEHFGVK